MGRRRRRNTFHDEMAKCLGVSCRPGLVAKLLIVLSSPFKTFGEWFRYFSARVLAFKFLNLYRHFGQHLVVFLAAGAGMQCGLETKAKELFILTKILAKPGITFAFDIQQPDPPLIAGRVDRFRTRSAKQVPHTR